MGRRRPGLLHRAEQTLLGCARSGRLQRWVARKSHWQSSSLVPRACEDLLGHQLLQDRGDNPRLAGKPPGAIDSFWPHAAKGESL